MTDVLVNVTVLTAIVGGIVAVLKTAGFPSRFAGVLALALGAVLGSLAAASGVLDAGTAAQGAWAGVIAGLTAAGAYSTTSAATKGS